MRTSRSVDSLSLLGAEPRATKLPPLNADLETLESSSSTSRSLPLTAREPLSSNPARRELPVPPPLPLMQFQGDEVDVAARTADGSIVQPVEHIENKGSGQHGREALRVDGSNKWLGRWFKQRDILERSMVQGERAAVPEALLPHMNRLRWELVYGSTESLPFDVPVAGCERQSASHDATRREAGVIPCLSFSADFESSNLAAAFRVRGRELLAAHVKCDDNEESCCEFKAPVATEHEYDLFCRPDVHTRGHVQWFYFRVQLRRPFAVGASIRLNIMNMVKSDALYNYGMKPLIYSERAARTHGIGWRHIGRDVAYYKNLHRQRKRPKRRQPYFSTLTFRYDVEYENDTLYFASCFPYSYSLLQQRLSAYENEASMNSIFRRKLLCRTLGGNRCDIVTITSYVNDPRVLEMRPVVVFTGRVHPGETNSSYVLQGLMDYLLSDEPAAARLRDSFIFKIVPMLNPDGVINGSYRCSLAGVDLNRRYETPSATLHPTVHAFKAMLAEEQESRGIFLFVDIHGHSRKKNAFVYGCDVERAQQAFPNKSSALTPDQAFGQRVFSRVFPYILCSTSDVRQGGYFAYDDCSFTVQRSKRATARVVAWDDLNISAAYTLEVSLCGIGDNAIDRGRKTTDPVNEEFYRHFSQQDLAEVGKCVGKAILQYTNLCDRTGVLGAENASGKTSARSLVQQSGAGCRLPVVHSLEEETILAPCLLSESSLPRLSRKSLRAHAERTLRRLIQMVAELQAENDDFDCDNDEPLIHGLLCELREDEAAVSVLGNFTEIICPISSNELVLIGDQQNSGGSDSDPSGDNMPASTLYFSKEWREFCSNSCITMAGDPEFVRRLERGKASGRKRTKASGQDRQKSSTRRRAAQRPLAPTETGQQLRPASQQLRLDLTGAKASARQARRKKRTGDNSDDLGLQSGRRSDSSSAAGETRNRLPSRKALHPLRIAVARKARQQQRELMDVTPVGSINMWAVHASVSDSTASSRVEPMVQTAGLHSPFRLAGHSEMARSTGTIAEAMGLVHRPVSRSGNPLVKHVPLRIIYTPKAESSNSRAVRFAQSGPRSGRRVLLRESNITSDGFSLLSHEET